jgi:hypothetical protein
MVAEFAHFGSPAAAEESMAFRARIMEELARAVKSRYGKGAFQVRKLRFRADASDSDDRRRALALARSSRCAVVIAGTIRQDGSEIGVTTAVLTPKRLGRGRPDEAPGQRILLASPPEAVAEKKATTAAEAAAVAQLALGVAFFHRRRYLESEDLLTSLRPQNYLALFYAAYAAFARRDYERAMTLSLQSAEIKPWQPALGIAAYSCFELGRNEEGRNLVSKLEEPDVERAIGPPWEKPVQLLPALAAFRLVFATLEEQVGDIILIQEKRDLDEQHLPQYSKAVECYYHQDYEGALTALGPNMAEPAAQDVALFAVASLVAGRSDAQEWAKRAENMIMPAPTTTDEAACRWLMEAFARLGDAEGAARILKVTLPLMPPETLAFHTQLLGIIHLSAVWDDPRIQQVLNDFGL